MEEYDEGSSEAVDAIPRRLILLLALLTLVLMGGGGAWLVASVQGRSLSTALLGDTQWPLHVLYGLVAGGVIAGGGWWIIVRPWMEPVRLKYADLIGPMMPDPWLQILVSVCAGVGEELLFRGALQHWLGIPITAIGFVALHGYLHPRDWRVSAYGVYLTLAMVGLGYMARDLGLFGPMIAHTLIDIILIGRLVGDWRSRR